MDRTARRAPSSALRITAFLLAVFVAGSASLVGCGGDDTANPVPLDAGADAQKSDAPSDG